MMTSRHEDFHIQYTPRKMHTVFALLCFVVVIHWLIFTISIRLTSLALWQSNDCPSASKATLMNMIYTSCEFIMNDYITTTQLSTTKPCAYFVGYTVTDHCLWGHYCRTAMVCLHKWLIMKRNYVSYVIKWKGLLGKADNFPLILIWHHCHASNWITKGCKKPKQQSWRY